jgi:hypothetical protein
MSAYDFDAEVARLHAEREQKFAGRTFTFGGQTFGVLAVSSYAAIKNIFSISTDADAYTSVEEAVFSMVDPRDDSHERLKKILESKEKPITFEDLLALQRWLLSTETGSPPTEPQPSVSSSPQSGDGSTGISSTEPAAA